MKQRFFVLFTLGTFLPLSVSVSSAAAIGNAPVEEKVSYENKAKEVLVDIAAGKLDAAEAVFADALAAKTVTRGGFFSVSSILATLFEDESDELRDLGKAAAPRLDDWVEKHPKAAVPRVVRALYHYKKGWEIRGNKFVSDTPASVFAPFKKELEAAEADLLKAIELEPKNPLPYAPLVDTLRSEGKPDELVEKAARDGLALLPGSMHILVARSFSLDPRWGGSWEKREQFVKDAIKTGPKELPLEYLAAALAVERCSLESASAKDTCLNQPKTWAEVERVLPLIERFPRSGFYPHFYAQALNKAKRYPESEKYYLLAAEREPAAAEHQYLAGWYYGFRSKDSGAGERALGFYNKAIKIDSQHANSYFGIGKVHLERREYDQAIPYFQKAAELDPKDDTNFKRLAQAQSSNAMYPQAIASFTKALELKPNDSDMLSRRAFCYLQTGNFEKGLADANAALKADPGNAYAKQLIEQSKAYGGGG